jgi:non-heme chloroperoxidase
MKKSIKYKLLKRFLLVLRIMIIIIAAVISAIIAFFPPKPLQKLESIAAPFRLIDFTDLPAVSRYVARDGTSLAFRAYTAYNPKQTVVLVHGSSGSSRSMHPLAKFLKKNSMNAYSLDVRGHGFSGKRGDITYVGQLEDDLEDFVNLVLKQDHGTALVGFSAGGGFALRFAADPRQKLFARYILLAPYIGYNSPTTRPDNGSWADASALRIIGITILGPIGEKYFGHLPVIAYAVDPQTAKHQTPQYSFRLLRNFTPHYNYASDIGAAKQPMAVLVGERDELFFADEFRPLFARLRPDTDVSLVPGTGHITLTTGPAGITAIAKALSSRKIEK